MLASELANLPSNRNGIRLDPRSKLMLLITLSILMLSTDNNGLMLYLKPFLALIPFILLLLTARYRVAFCYFILYALGFALELSWGSFDNKAFGFIVLMLSAIITRFAPCGITAFFLMTSTSVSEFIASMERMHVSNKITIPLSVIFRFFPTLREDARAINAAMKMRGISTKNPMLMFEYRFVPLILSAIKAGEDLSCSALTRGLGSPKKRTSICEIGFQLWDWLICGVCIASFLIFFFQQQIISLLKLQEGTL